MPARQWNACRCLGEGGASACFIWRWNATSVEYPREKCIHELFEEQVQKTPDAVAVVYEDEALSYGELNRRANRLAHYLARVGSEAG